MRFSTSFRHTKIKLVTDEKSDLCVNGLSLSTIVEIYPYTRTICVNTNFRGKKLLSLVHLSRDEHNTPPQPLPYYIKKESNNINLYKHTFILETTNSQRVEDD